MHIHLLMIRYIYIQYIYIHICAYTYTHMCIHTASADSIYIYIIYTYIFTYMHIHLLLDGTIGANRLIGLAITHTSSVSSQRVPCPEVQFVENFVVTHTHKVVCEKVCPDVCRPAHTWPVMQDVAV